MILDHIRNRSLYYGLGGGIRAALEYCAEALDEYEKDGTFTEGDVEIGGGVIMKIHPVTTHPAEGAVFEAHYRYTDIHFVIWGGERIGYADVKNLTVTEERPDQDYLLLKGDGDFLTLTPGCFMITFPDDAHSPAAKLGEECETYGKIVAKVPVK